MFNLINVITIKGRNYFTKGHSRSLEAKKNIIAAFLIKGVSMVVGFLLVPLTIHYVNPTKYGIWLTISSFLGFFSFFDIGLGNGLRNRLAEALAENDLNLAKIYISTTYAIMLIIIMPVMLIFVIVNPFINWVTIFNTPLEMNHELTTLMFIVFIFFCIKFVIQLFTPILYAHQKPALSNASSLIANIVSLFIIYLITKTTEGSLILLGTTLSVVPVIVLFIMSCFFFKKKYKLISPSFKYVQFHYARNLFNLGIQFFIMGIAGIIIFTSTNMIISQLYGPKEVTPYNIAYKYFSTISMIFTMALTPFWSAFTDAHHKKDFKWIRSVMKKLVLFWILLSIVALIMLVFSQTFYKIWIGQIVTIPFNLSLIVCIFFIMNTFGNIFTSFLNGVGKIRLSLYSAILEAILFIPIAIIFAKYLKFGVAGIIIASSFSPLIGSIWMPIQYFKIINNKASGIWNK
ncbi:MAG: MATE family efflux transporter [Ignavibacteriales bacterium]|nr:MATE family efflux transporter [Ignavibacteriales bacterium]